MTEQYTIKPLQWKTGGVDQAEGDIRPLESSCALYSISRDYSVAGGRRITRKAHNSSYLFIGTLEDAIQECEREYLFEAMRYLTPAPFIKNKFAVSSYPITKNYTIDANKPLAYYLDALNIGVS